MKIIQKSLNETRIKRPKHHKDYQYYEAHHILPKALFPQYKNLSKNKWNRVLLTAREHYVCHSLLVKHFRKIKNNPSLQSMSRALYLMNVNKRGSKNYEFIKLDLSCAESTKAKLRALHKDISLEEKFGKEKADIIKQKISKSSKGQKKAEWSESTLEKVRGANNHGAIKVNIYDEYGNLMFEANGDFKQLCYANDLPYASLKTSYQKDGIKIFQNKNSQAQLKNKKHLKYTNWYAKKVI
jgi:hypothetical protein